MITFQGAIEESPILLLQYKKNEWWDGTIIISYFGGSKNIFADCIYVIVLPKIEIMDIRKKIYSYLFLSTKNSMNNM